MKRVRFPYGVIALASLVVSVPGAPTHADEVTDWNQVLLQAIRTGAVNPPRPRARWPWFMGPSMTP